ncbi:hypothetical protein BMS3Bbin04_00444 [bacterium BMS3Bbin04]|nr:hypothetical protein BMS3Bbin04_00444 [bacterium BMS3Bbin04]
MSVLGVFAFGLAELARLGTQVTVPVFCGNEIAGNTDGFRADPSAVGTHVGNQSDGVISEIDTFV